MREGPFVEQIRFDLEGAHLDLFDRKFEPERHPLGARYRALGFPLFGFPLMNGLNI